MLKKDTEKGMLTGVCAGIANQLKIDATIIRALFAITALAGFGLPIIAYIVLALIMPKE